MTRKNGESPVANHRLRRGWVLGLVCCGVLLAVLWLVRVRYSRSHNFDPIHVQLIGDEWQDCQIFYQSIYGSWGPLVVDERYGNRWIQSPTVNGVVRVLLACPGQLRIPTQAVEVRAGSNWSVGRAVPVSGEVVPEKLPEIAGRCWTCLEFSPPIGSWIPLARGTINWQGDVWLLLVPIVQVLTLGVAGMTCWVLMPDIHRTSV